ncbi:MAG: hypothetical protein ABIS50_18055 [Luteolibacter sp.]|uniref:hypothetical protein n=1 Tax=Luteolibacter sp. TaxID=1962973 RepID=UPI003264BC72
MINRRKWITLGLAVAGAVFANPAKAQSDPGKTAMGQVDFTVYYATNGDPKAAGAKSTLLSEEMATKLRGEERLRFTNYRILGHEVQPLLRSYENWAQPLRPSDEVLVRFEARSKPTKDATKLDLELWLSRKKILKTDVLLQGNRPLFILGPEWRGGRLIIGVALAPKEKPGS